MKYEYYYYTTDESFDYGDGTCQETGYHGFEIDIDKDNNIDLSTLKGWGDFATEIEKVETLEDFKTFLKNNKPYIQEWDEEISNSEIFDELEIILTYNQLKGRRVA